VSPPPLSIVPKTPPTQRLLTPADVAAMLSVSRSFVYTLIHRGALAAIYVGRLPRIAEADLQAYIASCRSLGGSR
jgi:excisionase family DNA binding protein